MASAHCEYQMARKQGTFIELTRELKQKHCLLQISGNLKKLDSSHLFSIALPFQLARWFACPQSSKASDCPMYWSTPLHGLDENPNSWIFLPFAVPNYLLPLNSKQGCSSYTATMFMTSSRWIRGSSCLLKPLILFSILSSFSVVGDGLIRRVTKPPDSHATLYHGFTLLQLIDNYRTTIKLASFNIYPFSLWLIAGLEALADCQKQERRLVLPQDTLCGGPVRHLCL